MKNKNILYQYLNCQGTITKYKGVNMPEKLYQYLNCQGTITVHPTTTLPRPLYQYLNCQGTITKDNINNNRLLIFYDGRGNMST